MGKTGEKDIGHADMNLERALLFFWERIREDNRIGPAHISLYIAMLQLSYERGNPNPISVFSRDLMELAKISAAGTYHRCIRDLHCFGFIKYCPSYNHSLGSLVFLIQGEVEE